MRGLTLLLLSISFCFLCLSAQEQNGTSTSKDPSSQKIIEIEKIVTGMGGVGRYSCWIPFWVHLKSYSEKPILGTIEIRTSLYSQLVVQREVEIPAKKPEEDFVSFSVMLTCPASYNTTLWFKSKNPFLEIKTKAQLNLVSVHEPILGVIAKPSSILKSSEIRYLEAYIPKKVSQQMHLIDLNPNELPSYWAAYQSIDTLIFLNLNQTPLPTKQKESAIRDWICAGGRLFVNGGEGALKLEQNFLAPLLKFKVKGTSKIDPHITKTVGLGKYYINPIPEPANKVLALKIDPPQLNKKAVKPYEILIETSDGFPLLLRQKVGNGIILFSTVDITKAPFKNNLELLHYFTDYGQDFVSKSLILNHADSFSDLMISFLKMKKSTFLIITGFLFFYIMILLYLHRKISKGNLSIEAKIFLFPKWVFGFFLVGLFLVYFVSTTEWLRNIEILHFREDSQVALKESLICFSISKNADIQIEPSTIGYATPASLFEFDPGIFLPLHFTPQIPPKIEFKNSERGVTRTCHFVSLSPLSEKESLSASFKVEKREPKDGRVANFQLTIENGLGQPIHSAFLLNTYCCIKLGDKIEEGSFQKSNLSASDTSYSFSSNYPFSLLTGSAKNEALIDALSEEMISGYSRATDEPEEFHLVGFIKTPSSLQLKIGGKPIQFEEKESWSLIHYEFSIPVEVSKFGVAREKKEGKK